MPTSSTLDSPVTAKVRPSTVTEGDVSVDERGRLAREGRGQGLWFLTGPFGFAAFGGSAQGDRRLAFRIRTCTAIRNGTSRSFCRS